MSRLECKKIAEGRAKGLTLQQIFLQNPGLKRSIVDEAKDAFFCWQHGIGQGPRK